MKLIFCDRCGSVFSLSMEKEKQCDCGRCRGRYLGRYLNTRQAETNGKGFAIGMGTGSLRDAIYKLMDIGSDKERREYIQKSNIICWVRPHFGPGNPNTKLIKEEPC